MNWNWKVIGLLALLMAMAWATAGCQQAGPRYALEIDRSREALAAGRTVQGEYHLRRAREALGGAEGVGAADAELLAAEAKLQQGDFDAALALAERARRTSEHPQVREIEGKVALRQGDLTGALGHLQWAHDTYEGAEDVARAADLVALIRGLQAYALADVRGARDHWAGIADPAVRSSVETLAANVQSNHQPR